MNNLCLRNRLLIFLLAGLAACATPTLVPSPPPLPPLPRVSEPLREIPLTPSMASPVLVNETAQLPLLGYAQLLARMTAQEQTRERTMLATVPKTPITQLRMAMVLAQPRGPMDLARASALLENLLKSNDPVAVSVQPLAQALLTQYSERLKLESQNDKLAQQVKEAWEMKEATDRSAQLKELQDRNGELQEKLNALTNIERSLPVRPNSGELIPGTAQ